MSTNTWGMLLREHKGVTVSLAAAALVFGLQLPVPSGAAATPSGDPWVTDIVNSRTLGKRTILVATPAGYRGGTLRYPVLILLDADDALQFRLWIAQAAYLSDNSPGLPPVIIVGIVNGRSDRLHDMTPPATGTSVAEYKTAGGAAAFAEYIIGEVLPYVRAKYRALPTTILAGHSAGGLFGLDVAARRPDAFQGIIAMSPALWFNDSTLVETYSDLIARSRTHPRLFVASGGDEPDIDVPTKRFADRLDATDTRKGAFTYRRYPDATHALTPMSFGDGLRFMFEPVSSRHFAIETLDPATADPVAVNDVLQSSARAYAEAAGTLRLPEQLPERLVNRLGYRLLNSGKVTLAIQVFERNVRSYPESVNVYDSLADGLIAAGDTASAITQLYLAVKVARRTGAAVPADTQRKLEALESKK
jgi:predicted alpha/beta superfamily hydrolase